MSASQFTLYQSSDASAPVLSGTVGALLTVLDACLVNGYGSKAAAGWTKPFANSGNLGCYKNQGSGMSIAFNDNAPHVTALAREARATGYEIMTSVSTGTGPFPSLTQGPFSTGYVVLRKSPTADAVARNWIMLADAYTFYFFVLTTDQVTDYKCFGFGDFFSLKGTDDAYRCGIWGRMTENSGAQLQDGLATLSGLASANVGDFCPRTFGGTGASIPITSHGDAIKGNGGSMIGNITYPNGPDNALYLSPIWLCEPNISTVRGRMRGVVQVLHPLGNFTDGQTFPGSGDFAGKTFLIIKSVSGSPSGGVLALICLETSATVETN